jgi:serine/threonine-protein kinase
MQKLDGIRLISLVNKGGFCKIYKAQRNSVTEAEDQNSLLAVKILKRKYVKSPSHIFTIENEYKITRALAHKSILPTYDLLKHGTFIALTRKFVNAPSMKVFMERNQSGIWGEISSIISLAEALSYLHAQGVIHGDIKPSNILILPDFTIILLDFGVAEKVNCPGPKLAYSYSPDYSSPEKIMGFRSDFCDDVYSFGCVTCEFIFNRRLLNYQPFLGHFKNDAHVIPRFRDLKPLLLECISPNPKNRPRDGMLLYRRLREIFC